MFGLKTIMVEILHLSFTKINPETNMVIVCQAARG